MIKAYIIPKLSTIKIDNEISLRLTTVSDDNNFVKEPGTGGGGMGGEGNGSGETGWERANLGTNKEPFSSDIWK